MPVATTPDKPLTLLGPVAGGLRSGPEPQSESDSNDGSSSAGPAAPTGSVPVCSEEETLRQIRNLPPEVAVLLMSVGVLGVVLPGIIGTPAIIAGGLALWPKAFDRIETWFEKRCPIVHRESLKQMGRFLADLDYRYPQLRNR